MRSGIRLAFIVLGCTVAATAAQAAPITFTIQGMGTGTLGGQVFSGAFFEFVAEADTDDVFAISSGFQVVNSSTSITIAGLGSAAFTNEIRTTSNHNALRGGFGDFDVNRALMFVDNPVFASYDLMSAFGPVSGPATLTEFFAFPTTAGSLIFSDTGQITFTATMSSVSTPVPEPTTLVMLGAGLLGAGAARRRAQRGGAASAR